MGSVTRFALKRGHAFPIDAGHLDHMRKRFEDAIVQSDPFPHLIVRDVLPVAIYDNMERDCPSLDEWHYSAAFTTIRTEAQRLFRTRARWDEIRLSSRWLWRLLSEQEGGGLQQPVFAVRPNNPISPLLGGYARHWMSEYQRYIDVIDRLTLEKYQAHIGEYLSWLRDHALTIETPPIGLGQSVFCQRTHDWSIPPHTHDLPQLIQSMLYFPLPGSSSEQGTVLYRLKTKKGVERASLFATMCFEEREIERAVLMAYTPNTLASFMNTPSSIHGTPDIPGPPRRYVFTGAQFQRPAFASPVGHITLQPRSLDRLSR